MSTSIFDSFLTISSCDYYCNEIANKLGMSTFSYYYDKKTELQIPSNKHISTWSFPVDQWRRTFQLNKSKTIQKMGIENYVAEHKELNFHLTVKGYSIIYVVKFSVPVVNNKTESLVSLYREEESGQLSFIF